MAKVDLNKHREELIKAHKEVSDTKGPTNWALFTYEGRTNVLKLAGKGDGGIEELVDELSSGRIMYAYCRVIDPNTNLPKFVLINWQGEGVPEMRKGSCANHIRDVEGLLRGSHVTIMARSEDDVEEEDILKKVAKSSGANFSYHKEKARPDEGQVGPVGTNYHKINPQAAISTKKREEFWTKQQEEEQQRHVDESRKLQHQKSVQDEERKEREAKETSEREHREAERVRKIRDIKAAEAKANTSNKENVDWEKQQADGLKDAEERSRRSEQMRKERAAEAASLIGGSKQAARSVFEQRTSQFDQPKPGAPPPPRKLQHSFGSQDEPPQPTQRKAPIQIPRGEPEAQEEEEEEHTWQANRQPSPPPARQPSPPRARQPSPPPARQPSPPPARQPSPPPAREPSPPPARQAMSPPAQQPQVPNMMAQSLPPRQNSDDEEEDDEAWGDEETTHTPQAVIAQSPTYTETDEDFGNVQQPSSEPIQELAAEGQGMVARALYDYQAAEDNEISFDPDEILTNIEMIDEGWWIGTTSSGSHGMFPANYVELINQ